jgi:hypothetical protein
MSDRPRFPPHGAIPKTARLRELRLAKEAVDRSAVPHQAGCRVAAESAARQAEITFQAMSK